MVSRKEYLQKYYQKNKKRLQKNQLIWQRNNKTKTKSYRYKIKHDDLLLLGTACHICGKTEGRICIDHCHDTKNVRGILCNNCNLGIGLMDHDIDKLEAAINYLRGHCGI